MSGAGIVTDGLVFCVDAASKRSYFGGSGWVDLVGSNDGTLTNGPTFDSDGAGCILFDGTNDRCPTTYYHDGNERSFFIWVKFNSLTGTDGYQLTGTQEIAAYNYIGMKDGGNLYYYAGNIGGEISYSLSSGVWYNLGFAMDSGGGRIVYVNGENVFDSTGATANAATVELKIGCTGPSGVNQHFINGKIAAVYQYNRDLFTNEIRQNYLATRGRFQ